MLGDDGAEHRVAEEFEALVRLLARVLGAVGAVGKGELQQLRVDAGTESSREVLAGSEPLDGPVPSRAPPRGRTGPGLRRQAASSFAVT
ncbi:MAG: hypothetical protein ABSA31_07990 [Acidimicrobiales bacterium]